MFSGEIYQKKKLFKCDLGLLSNCDTMIIKRGQKEIRVIQTIKNIYNLFCT